MVHGPRAGAQGRGKRLGMALDAPTGQRQARNVALRLAAAGDGALDLEELDEALRYVGLFLGMHELRALQRALDTDDSGRVNLHEFMSGLFGSESERRDKHIAKVWAAVSGGASAIGPREFLAAFDPARHIDVVAGRKSADDVAGALAEELAVCARDDDRLDEAVVTRCLRQWGVGLPSHDLFSKQLEDCFGVAEAELSRDDATKLDTNMRLLRAKALEKKASGQALGFWGAGVCRHFDGAECGGLTIMEFRRVLERLGLPLPVEQLHMMFGAFGGSEMPGAPDREPRVAWKPFADALTEGQDY